MSCPPCSGHKRGFQIDRHDANTKNFADRQNFRDTIDREVDMTIAIPFLHRLRNSVNQHERGPLVVCCYNNKGGVLKSTSCAELGVMFSEMGVNVLLVDMDSQGSLTKSLVHLERPVDDVTFRTRVRDTKIRVGDLAPLPGGQLPTHDSGGAPIYYEIYEGLTELRRSNLANLLPATVTPIQLRKKDDKVLYDTSDRNDRIKRAKLAQEMQGVVNASRIKNQPLLDGGKYPQGSLHLVLGHHDTSSISNAISRAMPCDLQSTEGDAQIRLQKLHGSINYLIRQAATDVQADLVLVDLNPDASELNRTVLMQSDYILVPTWADSDGLECIVDLQTRLIQGQTRGRRPQPVDDYVRANKHAWIQVHQELIERTHKNRVVDATLAHLRVRPSFPKFLGLMIHSREQNRSIEQEELRDFKENIEELFKRLGEVLTPRTDRINDRAHVFYAAGTASRYIALSDLPTVCNLIQTGQSHMDATGSPQYVNHGGMWNHPVLKTLAKSLKKTISMIDFDDLKDIKEDKTDTINNNLMQIGEHRNRMFNICKSILHNLQRDRHGGDGFPNFERP